MDTFVPRDEHERRLDGMPTPHFDGEEYLQDRHIHPTRMGAAQALAAEEGALPALPAFHSIHAEDTSSGVTVVTLVKAKIENAASFQAIQEELIDTLLIRCHRKRVILNLDGVTFFSSACWNKLIIAERQCRSDGGSLRFCNVDPAIAETWRLVKLDQLFDIKPSLEEALQSFPPSFTAPASAESPQPLDTDRVPSSSPARP